LLSFLTRESNPTVNENISTGDLGSEAINMRADNNLLGIGSSARNRGNTKGKNSQNRDCVSEGRNTKSITKQSHPAPFDDVI
jgi:hypothetical protein